MAAVTSYVRTRTVLLTDKRINIMSEILNNIKLIKMYAWEESFADNVKGKGSLAAFISLSP